MNKKDIERFWSKVDIKTADECWEWLASYGTAGYGQFGLDGRPVGAHRIAYQIAYGAASTGLCVCHSCDNKRCVNPRHLWLGTTADNLQDMSRKGRGRGPGIVGEDHHNAKLTRNEVEYIRSSPKSRRQLAAEFGISPTQISRIRCNQSWLDENYARVPGPIYRFLSPSGELHETTNLTALARGFGLAPEKLSSVHSGSRLHHKGWTKA